MDWKYRIRAVNTKQYAYFEGFNKAKKYYDSQPSGALEAEEKKGNKWVPAKMLHKERVGKVGKLVLGTRIAIR